MSLYYISAMAINSFRTTEKQTILRGIRKKFALNQAFLSTCFNIY